VAADEDGDGGGRHRRDLDRRQVEDLPVILEVAAGGQAAQDGDRLVHPPPAAGPVHAEHLVVLAPRAGPRAQHEAAAGEHGRRRGLLGGQHRVADRQLEHERDEAQAAGDRTQRGDQRERLEEGLVLEDLSGAVRVERVGADRVPRVADAVRDDHRVVAGFLSRDGQGCVEKGLCHRFGVAEAHGRVLPVRKN
jgi:hypothetical protein